MKLSWEIVLILLIGLDDILGRPEKGQKEAEIYSNLPAEISEVLKSSTLDIKEHLKKSLVVSTSSNKTSSNIPPEKLDVVETPSDASLENTLKLSTPLTNLPELTVSKDQFKDATGSSVEAITQYVLQSTITKSPTLSEDQDKGGTDPSISPIVDICTDSVENCDSLSIKISTQSSVQPVSTNSLKVTVTEDLLEVVTDTSIAIDDNYPLSVEVTTQFSVQPEPTNSRVEIPFENQSEEDTDQSLSSLVHKTQRPSFASSISTGIPSKGIPAEKPLSDGPAKLEVRFAETGDLSTPTVPLHPSVTTEPPIEISFKDQFKEVTNKSPNESSLVYTPQGPSFASLVLSGVPSQNIPSEKPLSGGLAEVKDRFSESGDILTLTVPLHPLVTTESPIKISFVDQFKEVTNRSLKESSLVYKPQRPSFASSISSGVASQMITLGKPLPGGPAVLEDLLPENDNLSTVKVPLYSSQATKSPTESGVPSENIPPGKPLASGPAEVEDSFSESGDLSTPTVSPHPSVATESTIKIPFEYQFEEVTNKSPNESPFVYKPERPSFTSSISSGIPSQNMPPGKPLADGPAEVEDSFSESGDLSTPTVPLHSSVTTESPIKIPFEHQFEDVTNKSRNESPLVYKPQRPLFTSLVSSGVPSENIPTGKPLSGGPNEVENHFSESGDLSTPTVPLHPSVTIESTIKIPFEDQFEEVTDKSPNESPLVYKPQRPLFTSLVSSGLPSENIPTGKPLSGGPDEVENHFSESGDLSTPTVPLHPSVTTESPIKIPFEYQFEEVTNKSRNESPLVYKPQRPFFTSLVSSGVPSENIPTEEPLSGGPDEVGDHFYESGDLLTPTVPLYPSVATESTIKIPFKDQFEEVTDKSPNESPLVYKPERPSFTSSISSGIPSQNIPPGKLLAGGPAEVEDSFSESGDLSTPTVPPHPSITTDLTIKIPFEDQFEKVTDKSPNKSPLVHKPQRPFFISLFSSGVPSQNIPPGKPLSGGPKEVEDHFSESDDLSTPTVPLHPSVTTESPIKIPFEYQFEEVTNKSPNESPLVYKPQRPSFASSISSGVASQITPPGKPLPDGPAVFEDRFSVNSDVSTMKVPLHSSVTTKSPIEIAFEDQFEEVTNKSPNESPLVYKPQRPSFASSISSGVPNQIIPPGKPLPDGPDQVKDSFSELTNHLTVKIPLHSSVTTKLPTKILFEDQYEEVENNQNIPHAKPFAPVFLNYYFQHPSTTSSIIYETLKEKPSYNLKKIKVEHKKFKNSANAKSSSPNKPWVYETDLLMLKGLLEDIKADEKKFQDFLRANYLKARGDVIEESRGPRGVHLENHLPRKNRNLDDMPARGPLLKLLSRKKAQDPFQIDDPNLLPAKRNFPKYLLNSLDYENNPML